MAYLRQWKRWIRPLVLLVYFILLIVALPLMIVEFEENKVPQHLQAWFIGGLFVLMAIPMSLWDILQHLVYYTQPHLQRHIIRILWMVPIYALNAWFALRFPEAAIYLDTMRECYEAYVIYNFFTFLMNYLHTTYEDFEGILAQKAPVKHMIPFCCFKAWPMGRKFIQMCKHGTLQYTVIRPVTTILALICEMAHKYDEGSFSFKSAWLYLTIINNISQVWALYCLVLFYKATKKELAPINPIWKFACVKFVVFFSFWQAVFISILEAAGAITPDSGGIFSTKQKVGAGIQDFAICIEMFLAALAHHYSFTSHPYMDLAAEPIPCWASFKSMWDVSDVRNDVVEHVRVVGKTVKGTVIRNQPTSKDGTEKTPLLLSEGDDTEIYAQDNHATTSNKPFTDLSDDPCIDLNVEVHNNPDKQRRESSISPTEDLLSLTSSIDYGDSMTIPSLVRHTGTATPSLNNFLQSGSSVDSRLSEFTVQRMHNQN